MMMVNHPNRAARVGRVSKIKSEIEGWRVCIDGKPTSLEIVKGDTPRYRDRQEYWVMKDDEIVAQSFSVHGCMVNINAILEAAAG